MKNYSRNVSLICPVCGNSLFETLNDIDNPNYRCSDCNNIYTKDQLLSENEENINVNKDEMLQEIIDGFEKDLQKQLNKIFK